MSASVHTERLILVPMTPEFLRASIRGDIGEAKHLLGWALPGDWPDVLPVLKLRLRQLEADSSLQPWLLRAMILPGAGRMIGHVGFHSAPGASYLSDWGDSAVELGVSVVPEFQRQGYARESVLGLMRWARDLHGVGQFVVSVGRTNEASRRLFSNLGFRRVAEHVDEIDGVEDVSVLDVSAPNLLGL